MFSRLVICAIVFLIGLQGSMASAFSGMAALVAEQVELARELDPVATLKDPDSALFASRGDGHENWHLTAGMRPRLLATLADVSYPPVPRSIPPNLLPRLSQQVIKLQV